LSMRYEPTGRRAAAFADAFDPETFDVAWPTYTINDGETDQLVCPQIALPADFDSYFEQLSSRMRKKIRRATRKNIDSGLLTLKGTTPQTFESEADQLVSFWLQKWGDIKDSSQLHGTAQKYRELLERCHKLGILYMPSLWDGDRMLGAIAHVIDPYNRVLHSMVEGRDSAAEDVEVGLLLHTRAIRSAIKADLHTYDFGHGNEAYKYSYGAEDKRVSYLTITRRDGAVNALDPMGLSEALSRTHNFVERGKIDRALAALKQLSAFVA